MAFRLRESFDMILNIRISIMEIENITISNILKLSYTSIGTVMKVFKQIIVRHRTLFFSKSFQFQH